MACRGSVALDGKILANGGGIGPFGSGGAVRVIAEQITGMGTIDVRSNGRIRIESNARSGDIVTFPETPTIPPGDNPVIWPTANEPQVTVLSVGKAAVPEDPTAPLSTSADITLQGNDPVEIIVETKNFAIEGRVLVRSWSGPGPVLVRSWSGSHRSGPRAGG